MAHVLRLSDQNWRFSGMSNMAKLDIENAKLHLEKGVKYMPQAHISFQCYAWKEHISMLRVERTL